MLRLEKCKLFKLKNNNTDYNINWNILHHIGEIRNLHDLYLREDRNSER